jgi:beta-lactamase superfamily II metal-dependent hydrolase
MAWQLRIWHVGLNGTGDATIIFATDGATTKTVLIDGGRLVDTPLVLSRLRKIATQHGLTSVPVDIIINTHYDLDHLNGVRTLLESNDTRFDHSVIIDQGQPGLATVKTKGDGSLNVSFAGGHDDKYVKYEAAIKKVGTRTRVTEKVIDASGFSPGTLAAFGYHSLGWLVGKEVLWANWPNPTAATATPATPLRPELICIAANLRVLQRDGTTEVIASKVVSADRSANQRSMAFLLRFGSFKYYIGGDIEAVQESGKDRDAHLQTDPVDKSDESLMMYLNPTDDAAGRVHAMKTSHHGSKFSSSPEFIQRLRPALAIISCGPDNQYGHPDQDVVDELTTCDYYLTGEDLRNGTTTLTNQATVAGVLLPTGARKADSDIEIRAFEASLPNFEAVCYRPKATPDTNIGKSAKFAYEPFSLRSTDFP